MCQSGIRHTGDDIRMDRIPVPLCQHTSAAVTHLFHIHPFIGGSRVSVVWVYISYLRKKLAALGADIEIRAARNAGYSLDMRHD